MSEENVMSGFDIDALLRFSPAEYLCERCYALISATTGITLRCPCCGARYLPSEAYPDPRLYLAERGFAIHSPDLIEHSRRLARIARDLRISLSGGPHAGYPPLRALLEALNTAQYFVHFTTYGLSALLLGALKLTSLRIDVRGVVSGLKQEVMMRELIDFATETPRLQLQVFQAETAAFPHQKIVIIDGLLAFKGSANMTDFGWRKAARGREVIEPVTNIAEVIELNNRFFSPLCAALSPDRSNGARGAAGV